MEKPKDEITNDFRKRFADQWNEDWTWAKDDRNVKETVDYNEMQVEESLKTHHDSYAADDFLVDFNSPGKNEDGPASPPMKQWGANSNMVETAVENGWSGVSQTYYGKVMLALAREKWLGIVKPDGTATTGLRKYFYFPVYGFGYNWTQSKRDSGA